MLSQNIVQFGIILQNKIKKQIIKQLNSTVKLITLPHGEGAQLSCMHADTTKEQTFTGKWMPYKKTDVKIFYSSFLYNYHLGT